MLQYFIMFYSRKTKKHLQITTKGLGSRNNGYGSKAHAPDCSPTKMILYHKDQQTVFLFNIILRILLLPSLAVSHFVIMLPRNLLNLLTKGGTKKNEVLPFQEYLTSHYGIRKS